MPRTVGITVYKFEELTDAAKEKARDWWRELESQEFNTEFLFDDFEECAKRLGIEFGREPVKLMGGGTRYDPTIFYSGFSSQGDGASFAGTYRDRPDCVEAIKDHAPTDEKLHAIADALNGLQVRTGRKLAARIERDRGARYCHEYTANVSAYIVDEDGDEDENQVLTTEVNEELTRIMREFMRWMYRQLDAEYTYRMSDEAVDESIIANEYEFTAEGKRYR